jgi:hypothetical protein
MLKVIALSDNNSQMNFQFTCLIVRQAEYRYAMISIETTPQGIIKDIKVLSN